MDDKFDKHLLTEKLPEGWTKDSVEKFAKTIGKDVDKEGFFDACVIKLGKHIDDDQTVKGMCANMKDVYFGSTYWRGKDKTAKEKEASIKKHQNV